MSSNEAGGNHSQVWLTGKSPNEIFSVARLKTAKRYAADKHYTDLWCLNIIQWPITFICQFLRESMLQKCDLYKKPAVTKGTHCNCKLLLEPPLSPMLPTASWNPTTVFLHNQKDTCVCVYSPPNAADMDSPQHL